jgi:hypothetical protein
MECLEFRRAAGADPQHLSPDAERHRAQCDGCSQHHRQLLAMDATIHKALNVPAREYSDAMRRVVASQQRAVPRPRWLALAATIVAGVLIGSVLWIGQPRDSLASEVVAHLRGEPDSLEITQVPADPVRVARVLGASGLRLRGDPGQVSYVTSCPFRGATVPHLVVQTAGGPVTVLVLRHVVVPEPRQFHEQGYAGTIAPFGPGSIAVIGATAEQTDDVAARIRIATEWIDD